MGSNLSELFDAMMLTMASARVNLARESNQRTDSGTILIKEIISFNLFNGVLEKLESEKNTI